MLTDEKDSLATVRRRHPLGGVWLDRRGLELWESGELL